MADDSTMNPLTQLINAAHQLIRLIGGGATGARGALADVARIDHDAKGYGCLIALHASITLSNGGTDVTFDTNPDYDVGIHSIRAACEVGTAENTTNNGGAAFSAAHCAVKIQDLDAVKSLTNSKAPAAGAVGGIDLMLLGANGGPGHDLQVPYVFRSQKGSTTITTTFATDASWPGVRRVGVVLGATYLRRSFRDKLTA